MFNIKLKFTKKAHMSSGTDDIDLELIYNYWGALFNNGQCVGGFDIYSDNKNIFLTAVLPTEDSLADKNNNVYANEYRKKLADIFDFETIREGVNLEYHKSCVCEKPSWYYMYQTPYQEESVDMRRLQPSGTAV